MTLDDVAAVIRSIRLPGPGLLESDLVGAVAAALQRAGMRPGREVRLGARARVDLMVHGVAIEVKKGRPDPRRLRAQLDRYAGNPAVQGVILVLERSAPLPATIRGTPVTIVSLNANWGIAL